MTARPSWLRLVAVAVAAIATLPSLLAAQLVGTRPERSPFRDVEFRQEVTTFTGWYSSSAGVAGVLPRGGPMLGLRWEALLAGPVRVYTRLGGVLSERTVINPARTRSERAIGDYSWPVFFGDLGLNADLTGRKSYRRLVPMISVGAGAVTDFVKGPDVGQFEFGTRFAATYGGGVRYVPGGRWQFRLDAHDILHRIKYPPAYRTNFAGSSGAVLTDPDDDRGWHHNLAIQLGLTYTFRR